MTDPIQDLYAMLARAQPQGSCDHMLLALRGLQAERDQLTEALSIATRAVELLAELERVGRPIQDLATLRHRFEEIFSAPPYEFSTQRFGELSAWPDSYRQYHVQCAWYGFKEGVGI